MVRVIPFKQSLVNATNLRLFVRKALTNEINLETFLGNKNTLPAT